MEPEELTRLVDRRFKILKELRRQGEFGELNISELEKKTGLHYTNISKYISKLESKKLVTTRGEKHTLGRPKYCRLTDRCRRILDAFFDAAQPEPKKLKKPDSEWVEYLIGIICPPARSSTAPTKSGALEGGTPESPPSEGAQKEAKSSPSDEALKEALYDFHQSCQTTRIWEYKQPEKQGEKGKAQKKRGGRDDIWSFFERALENEARLPKTMSDLRTIVANALREKRKNVIGRIRRTFASKIEDIATTPDADMQTRYEAVWILNMILGASEKWGKFTGILGTVMMKEKEDTYKTFIQCLFSPFKEFYHKQGKELRQWFYTKMSDEDPTVRSRARSFYSAVRSL